MRCEIQSTLPTLSAAFANRTAFAEVTFALILPITLVVDGCATQNLFSDDNILFVKTIFSCETALQHFFKVFEVVHLSQTKNFANSILK